MHDIFHGIRFAGYAGCRGGAYFGTASTVCAAGELSVADGALSENGSRVTGFHAASAADAEIGKEHELRMQRLRFRIAAPEAVQRTPLEENGGSQTGAVLGGHALDIVDDTLCGHGCSFFSTGGWGSARQGIFGLCFLHMTVLRSWDDRKDIPKMFFI